MHAIGQVRTYPRGYTPFDGYLLARCGPAGGGADAFTFGPSDRWLEVQVHGPQLASFVYVLVGPPGTYPGVSPGQAPVPPQRTPIMMAPGMRLTLSNLSATPADFSMVYREML